MATVTGQDWDPNYDKNVSVEIGVQCGSVDFTGSEKDYGSSSTSTEIPVQAEQVFCSYVVYVDGKPTYVDRGGTVVVQEEFKDGVLLDQSVVIPFDSRYGYVEPYLADEVGVHNSEGLGSTARVKKMDERGKLKEGFTCDTDQPQGFIGRTSSWLKNLFKK